MRRRSRLPFHVLRAGNVRCVCCGQLTDVFGDHAEEACRVHGGKYDWAAHNNRVRDDFANEVRQGGEPSAGDGEAGS